MTRLDHTKANRNRAPRKSPAKRSADRLLRQERNRPTQRQLRYLKHLGVSDKPNSRAYASELIEAALKAGPRPTSRRVTPVQ